MRQKGQRLFFFSVSLSLSVTLYLSLPQATLHYRCSLYTVFLQHWLKVHLIWCLPSYVSHCFRALYLSLLHGIPRVLTECWRQCVSTLRLAWLQSLAELPHVCLCMDWLWSYSTYRHMQLKFSIEYCFHCEAQSLWLVLLLEAGKYQIRLTSDNVQGHVKKQNKRKKKQL